MFKKLLTTIVLFALFSNAYAKDEIKKIKVYEIKNYVKQHSEDKPLILYLSSTDGSCRPCVYSNGGMDEAAEDLKKTYNMVAVYFNPWRDFSKQKELIKKYELTGLPSTMIIYKDKLLASQHGAISHKARVFKDFWEKRKSKK